MRWYQYPLKYIFNVLVAIDQLGNALLAGDPDELISSRFGKWLMTAKEGSIKWYIAMSVCMVLDLFDKEHCKDAIESEEGEYDLWKTLKRKTGVPPKS